MSKLDRFRLKGLSGGRDNPNRATCDLIHKEDWFHATIEMELSRRQALWDFCTDDWDNPKAAIIEHDGLDEEGFPSNPKLINIEYL